jgi:DNA-binding transcriptional regulator YiaG
MLKSVKELSAIAGTNRETVQKRADQLGLVAVPGEKGAKLYDSRYLLQLIPTPTRASKSEADGESEGATLEEARIRSELAKAEKTELEIEKMKGSLADVSELLSSQNAIFDEISAIVKKSAMTDNEKEDCLSSMSKAVRYWESGE